MLLTPGSALDLGCGAGGDALWMAERGWRVTAVDISTTAVHRVAERARTMGLADRLTTMCLDLTRNFPSGSFDLVCAVYLHSPGASPRQRLLRAAAQAVLPGGRLLVVDHGSVAPWSWDQNPAASFPKPQEVAADLDLHPSTWIVERADTPTRRATGPGGQDAEVIDHVLTLRRSST
ncbi:SAM-dependent methyltransferase [Nocardioides aurantiacus]|uniref:SAM-dependent methyltransferase n=1 Tax=Nocardioides aurantiacus TaxID=86796 RepID=UPI000F4948A1|nr:class I SAM-dependent methyltransferase [Nocardioides aurantiacus]